MRRPTPPHRLLKEALLPGALLLGAVVLGAASLVAGEPEEPAVTDRVWLRPDRPAPATVERMRAWSRDTRSGLAPVLREWEELARAARGRPGVRLTAGCRSLETALAELDRQRLPLAPDASVSLHLDQTLRALAEAARSCTHGAYFLTSWRLQQAEASWRELRGRLELYDLTP